MEQALRKHFDWPKEIKREYGSSKLFDGIDVYVDFDWYECLGKPNKSFTHYGSLATFIKERKTAGKRPLLFLTDRDGVAEGFDHNFSPKHDVLVVRVKRFIWEHKDAATAYFAALEGIPIVTGRGFSQTELASILDKNATVETILSWIQRNPEVEAELALKLGAKFASSTSTPALIEVVAERLKSMSDEELNQVADLLNAGDFPANLLRALNLSKRKDAVDEFEQHLKDRDWKEPKWQEFFTREDWIFGHGLLYQFLKPVEEQYNAGGKDMSNTGGQVGDYAVRTVGANASFVAFVEIKTPDTALISDKKAYRNNAYAIDEELAGSIAQLLSQCDFWVREECGKRKNTSRSLREGWQTAQPRGILVVGHTENLKLEDMRQSFHLFREHLHGAEIITFDELYERAKAIANPSIDATLEEDSDDQPQRTSAPNA